MILVERLPSIERAQEDYTDTTQIFAHLLKVGHFRLVMGISPCVSVWVFSQTDVEVTKCLPSITEKSERAIKLQEEFLETFGSDASKT